jgi:hypothetical protein
MVSEFAFPNSYHNDSYGMTLRDYFAGHALAGICSNAEIILASSGRKGEMVRRAYEMADLMLIERNKQ